MDQDSVLFVVVAYVVSWITVLAYAWHVRRARLAARAAWDAARADAGRVS